MTSDISILDCQQKLTNSSKNCCGAKENRIVHLNVVLYFRDFGKVDPWKNEQQARILLPMCSNRIWTKELFWWSR